MTRNRIIDSTIQIVHNAGVTFLVASFGFMVASWVAHNISGFQSWADGFAITCLWNFVLAIGLYALLALLFVGRGVARLIGEPRRR